MRATTRFTKCRFNGCPHVIPWPRSTCPDHEAVLAERLAAMTPTQRAKVALGAPAWGRS